MACDYDWRDGTVWKTFTGFVDGADFIDSAHAVSADARFDDVRFIVNDLFDISGHRIDAETYLEVAASRVGAARTNPNFRVIFIASEQVTEELRAAVQPALMTMHFDPRFFHSRQEASRWMTEQPPSHDFRATGF